jgi:ribosomal protein L37AE/L43A
MKEKGMQCPTCGEYGDLVHATVKKTGQRVIVCAECDNLWAEPGSAPGIDASEGVAEFLAAAGLVDDWKELELLARLPPG